MQRKCSKTTHIKNQMTSKVINMAMETTRIENLAGSSALSKITELKSKKPVGFTDLPDELKVLIWNFSLEQRIVRILPSHR